MMNDMRVWVCDDCGAQLSLFVLLHECRQKRLREFVELMELWLDEADNAHDVLWLVRVLYRLRRRMNGLEQYGDRAALARRVCGLMDI